MERLIEDANKISGLDLDISSFSDVVEAIHIVQTEMGITGTTAKEAATTIQGSSASMKSSWRNLLTGIADGTQNMDLLVDEFVESVKTYAGNLVPRIGITFDSIQNIVKTKAPAIGSFISSSLRKIVKEAPNYVGMVEEVISSVIGTLTTNSESLSSSALTLFMTIISAFENIVDQSLPLIESFVPTIATGLMLGAGTMFETGLKVLGAIISGLASGADDLVDTAADVLTDILDGIDSQLDIILPAGLKIVLAIGNGIIEHGPELFDGAVSILDKIVSFTADNIDKVTAVASGIIKTVKNGLNNGTMLGNLASGAISILSSIVDFADENMDDVVDIASMIVSKIVSSLENPEIYKNLVNGAKTILRGISGFIISNLSMLANGAINIVYGIVTELSSEESLQEMRTGAKDFIINLVKELTEIDYKKLFDSVFGLIKVGGEIINGIIEGILDPETRKDLWEAIKMIGAAAAESFWNAVLTRPSLGRIDLETSKDWMAAKEWKDESGWRGNSEYKKDEWYEYYIDKIKPNITVNVNAAGADATQVAREVESILRREQAAYD